MSLYVAVIATIVIEGMCMMFGSDVVFMWCVCIVFVCGTIVVPGIQMYRWWNDRA